jgi:hypothetical protein
MKQCDSVTGLWLAMKQCDSVTVCDSRGVVPGSDAVDAAEEFYSNGGQAKGHSSIEQISAVYGAQAVVVSIDPRSVYVADPEQCPHQVPAHKAWNISCGATVCHPTSAVCLSILQGTMSGTVLQDSIFHGKLVLFT